MKLIIYFLTFIILGSLYVNYIVKTSNEIQAGVSSYVNSLSHKE